MPLVTVKPAKEVPLNVAINEVAPEYLRALQELLDNNVRNLGFTTDVRTFFGNLAAGLKEELDARS